MLTWPVARKVLIYTMETEPTTFREFSSLAFDTSMSATSLYPAFWRQKFSFWSTYGRIHTWLRFAVLVLAAYILTFPTIVSTMTGYQSALEPYTKDPENTYYFVDARNITQSGAPITVVDGQRIGLKNNVVLSQGDEEYIPLAGCMRISYVLSDHETDYSQTDN